MKGKLKTGAVHDGPESDDTPESSADAHGMAALKKRAKGGKVEGAKPRKRLDRMRDGYAKGGAVKGKGKTTVNVIIAGQGGGADKMPPPTGGPPMPMMPPAGPPMPPPRPPMLPPTAMPPPNPGAPPMMGRKDGGRVGYPIKDGAGGGEGRKEKIKAYGAKAK